MGRYFMILVAILSIGGCVGEEEEEAEPIQCSDSFKCNSESCSFETLISPLELPFSISGMVAVYGSHEYRVSLDTFSDITLSISPNIEHQYTIEYYCNDDVLSASLSFDDETFDYNLGTCEAIESWIHVLKNEPLDSGDTAVYSSVCSYL